MIFVLIIVLLILFVSGYLNIKFIKMIAALYAYVKEFEFIDGDSDEIPKWAISKSYPNVTLLYSMETVDKEENAAQIVDTSLYLKNNIITLTNFVQEQDLKIIAQEFGMEGAKEVQEIADYAVLKNVTVHHLKDGRWIWRQNQEEDYNDNS